MAPIGTPFDGPDRTTRMRNRHAARRKLSRMERMENHAQQALGEQPLPESGLSEFDVSFYRDMYRATYQNLVGVDPTQREQLRKHLELACKTGETSVESILDGIRSELASVTVMSILDERRARRSQANGSAS